MKVRYFYSILMLLACLTDATHTHADDRVSLGEYLLKVQRYKDAIDVYDELIGQNSRDYKLYHNRGVAMLHTGQLDKAISDFNKAIALNPKDAESHNSRGVAWFYKNNFDLAISDYSRAIELNPKFTRAYNQLAWILSACPDQKFRNGARAVEIAKKAVELEPSAYHYDTLAAAYAEAGQFKDAVKIQKRALLMQLTEGRTQALEKYTERLRAYEAQKPWREKNAAGMKRTETPSLTAASTPVQTRIEISPIETPPVKASASPPASKQTADAGNPPDILSTPAQTAVDTSAIKPVPEQISGNGSPTKPNPEKLFAEGISTYPYTILIGASQYRQKANRIAMKMRSRGDMAFVSNEVTPDNIEWHRIFVGQFKNQADARKTIEELLNRKFRDPQVVQMPFAIQVALAVGEMDAKKRESNFLAMGYIVYSTPEPQNPGKIRILIGAYETEDAAVKLMQDLRGAGIKPRLVRR
ncbi:MAG: tetratricopeptide repeat protein [Desulfatirhabdiaceae bacterium]